MLIYIFFLIIPIMCYYNKRIAQNTKFLFWYLLILSLFVGCADMLGGFDRYIYGFYFDNMSEYVKDGDGLNTPRMKMLGYRTEMGYVLWNYLLAHCTQNRYVFIFATTILIYSLLFISIKKYAENYPFALMLFMALWFFFTFTYLRQVIAATIGYLAVQYVIDRKLWKFLIVVVIAFSFHNSAIILLPFYFVPLRKFPKNQVIIILGICLLLGLTNITTGLFDAYSEVTNDQERLAEYNNEGSFRLAYFVEAVFFLYFIFKNYAAIDNNDKRHLILMNMSIGFCAILLFFIRSENGGRLSWYYMIGVISLLSYFAKRQLPTSSFGLTMSVVSLFLYIRILLQWGSMLTPYKSFFTPGTRPNDPMVVTTEYDHNYDHNKFYK